MTDMVSSPALSDLTIGNCEVGFDVVNLKRWTERLVVNDITIPPTPTSSTSAEPQNQH